MPSRKDGKKSENDLENMQPAQALCLAILCLEFEAEVQPARSLWRLECNRAIEIIKQNYLKPEITKLAP